MDQTPLAAPYRYELAAAAADPRFQRPLSELDHTDLEAWLVRARRQSAPSVGGWPLSVICSLGRSAAACARRAHWRSWRRCVAAGPCRARSASTRNSAHWMLPSPAHPHPTAGAFRNHTKGRTVCHVGQPVGSIRIAGGDGVGPRSACASVGDGGVTDQPGLKS